MLKKYRKVLRLGMAIRLTSNETNASLLLLLS
jgi:hypothetical protein